MRKILLGLAMLFASFYSFSQIEGTWKMAPQAGAIGVGPGQGNTSWWSNSLDDVTTRACFFDDTFVFNSDGSFNNVMGTETWLETWQGVPEEQCGTPVAPHDGSNPATWAYDSGAGTLTLTGVGAHLGLAKVYNGGELTDPANAPASITYIVTTINPTTMVLDIAVVGDGWWRFIFEKVGATLPEPTTVPPTPTHASEDVIGIYTDIYSDLAGTDFTPWWNQTTVVTVDYLAAGNNTLKYTTFNYQGTQLAGGQDLSSMEFMHVDVWTPDATVIKVTPISLSTGELLVDLTPLNQGSWNSYDIPLTDFTGISMADIHQLKFDGQAGVTPSTVYLDNIYFWKNPTVSGTDATLSDLQVDGATIPGFSPGVINYVYGLVEGTTTIPQITSATPTDPNVTSVNITQATTIPGDATVVVTAEDGITTKTYTVSYKYTIPNSVPPTPSENPENVISMFSDSYTNVAVDTWLTVWSQGIVEDLEIASNPVKKYSNLNFAGIETTGGNLIDATGMTHFHIDIWTPDANDFKVKLVDFGENGVWDGGDDTEYELIFPAPATSTWISYDLPLSDFITLDNTGHMAQLILSKPNLGTIYVDNIYYYNAPTEWTGAIDNDWHNAGNWTNGVPSAASDVTIPAGLSNYPTINISAVCNNITLNSMAGNTATLLDNGNLSVLGTVTVERYFTGNDVDWHLVSSPLTNATAGVFTDMYLQSFDESTNTYTDIVDVNTPLIPLTGYGLYSTLGTDNTVTFTGTMNAGNQQTNFTASNQGWNLLGNPYVSSIDWENVTIPAGMSSAVHYIEAATGNDLSYVQGVGGPGSQFIPPMQGFFIEASGAGTLTLTDANRSHNGAGTFYKDYNPDLVVLEASNGNYSDQAWIHFNENAGVEHDGIYDAYKRISTSNVELPQLFSITPEGTFLSVNGLPETNSVPLGFTAVESGVFTINAIETGDFEHIYLEDLLTNNVTNLLTNSYTFNYNSGDQVERFVLHFNTLAVSDLSEQLASIYTEGHTVHINLPEKTDGQVMVYNTTGQLILSDKWSSDHHELTLNQTGFYILKIQLNDQVISKKVFIK